MDYQHSVLPSRTRSKTPGRSKNITGQRSRSTSTNSRVSKPNSNPYKPHSRSPSVKPSDVRSKSKSPSRHTPTPSRSSSQHRSRSPGRALSRHSSKSRERRRDDISHQIDSLKKELSKLSGKSCARCKSDSHRSADCHYSFSRNFCSLCKCYHDEKECQKLFSKSFSKNS